MARMGQCFKFLAILMVGLMIVIDSCFIFHIVLFIMFNISIYFHQHPRNQREIYKSNAYLQLFLLTYFSHFSVAESTRSFGICGGSVFLESPFGGMRLTS